MTADETVEWRVYPPGSVLPAGPHLRSNKVNCDNWAAELNAGVPQAEVCPGGWFSSTASPSFHWVVAPYDGKPNYTFTPIVLQKYIVVPYNYVGPSERHAPWPNDGPTSQASAKLAVEKLNNGLKPNLGWFKKKTAGFMQTAPTIVRSSNPDIVWEKDDP